MMNKIKETINSEVLVANNCPDGYSDVESSSPNGNTDNEFLNNLGYKAELKREYSPLELFLMSFSVMGVAPSVASTLINQLSGGGVGMTWGWFVPCVFIFSVGYSMSEFASAMPSAGGLFWWTYLFAPTKLKSYLSFLNGYSDVLGIIAGTGSINYGCSLQILEAVSMGSGYVASKGVTFAIYIGIHIIQCFMSFMPSRYFAKIHVVTSLLNVATVAIICIALPIGMKHKGLELNTGDYVFGDTTKLTNYPYGMTFVMTWTSAVWSVSSHHSSVHMAEEASNARVAVPFAIIGSVGAVSLLAFVVLTVLTACMDNSSQGIQDLLSANIPMATIIERALSSKWSIAIISITSVQQFFMGMNTLLSSSRQVYAFARDDCLPFSKYLKLTTTNHLPIPGALFSIAIAALIGLLILAGPVAANAIFNMAIASLYLSWCLPIWLYAFSTQRIESPGPVYAGFFFSKLNAVIASLWGVIVICVVNMFPSNVPVTSPTSMNYTCVVCGTVWIGASLYWLFSARKWYHGPSATLESDTALCESIEAKEWEGLEKTTKQKEKGPL